MRMRQLFLLLVVNCCNLCTALAASTGPDDRRPLTDPKSVGVKRGRPACADRRPLLHTKCICCRLVACQL